MGTLNLSRDEVQITRREQLAAKHTGETWQRDFTLNVVGGHPLVIVTNAFNGDGERSISWLMSHVRIRVWTRQMGRFALLRMQQQVTPRCARLPRRPERPAIPVLSPKNLHREDEGWIGE